MYLLWFYQLYLIIISVYKLINIEVIGKNFTVYQQIIVGRGENINGRDMVVIGDNVILYAETVVTKDKLDTKCFKSYPNLGSVIGGLGCRYNKDNLNLLIRNILIKLGFFSLKEGNWGM